MYTVMIVEDEMLVRLGFKNSIPWDKYGMTVVGDASNGLEAWEAYDSADRKPDVVITDLRMPVMDGMELIRKIRETDQRTRIVILSCLEDFDLIRQAMQMDVSNYILKLTMTRDETDRVLAALREELDKLAALETSRGLIRNPDSAKGNVIKNYMFYRLYSEDEFVRHIANLKLRLHPERLVVCLMEIDRFEKVKAKFQDEKGELVRATMLNVLGELLASHGRGEALADDDSRYLLVFSFRDRVSERDIHTELHDLLAKVQKVLARFFNVSVTVGISGIRNQYGSLRALYQESQHAVRQKYYYGAGRLISRQESASERLEEVIRSKMEGLAEKWRHLDAAAQAQLEGIARSFLEAGRLSQVPQCRQMFLKMMHAPAILAQPEEWKAAALDATYGERLAECETWDESVETFGEWLTQRMALHTRRRQLSREIAQAVRIIRERYGQDLSLQQIAAELEMTPNYVSALFKKELETTFTEYLNRVRLDKAKELLLNTNLKSYEIAERVGFSDDSYFSRAFKKHVGVRPNGYRRMWVQDDAIADRANGDERGPGAT